MPNLTPKQFILTILICLFPYCIFSQNLNEYEKLATKIDSLAHLGLPRSALVEVGRLDNLARRTKNAPQQVRAAVYRMHFQSYLKENALVDIIRQLKLDIESSVYPVKPVLQSLLADIYWKYYQQNRYRFSSRSTLEKPDADFTKWDLKTIVNEVSMLYKQSLKEKNLLQKTSIDVLEGILIGDSKTRYLRPTLYDLLAHRALDFYLTEEPNLLKPKMPFSLKEASLFATNEDFITTPVITSDTLSISYQGIKLLQELTRFHLNGNASAALADVNLKRLSFIYRKSVHPQKASLYLQSLNDVTLLYPGNEINSEALVLLGQYYQGIDSLVSAKSYFDRAVKASPKSMGADNATNFMGQIEKKELSLAIENVVIPHRPVLVLLNYRNLSSVNYRLFKLSDKQMKDIDKLDERRNLWRVETIQPTEALLSYLSTQRVLSEKTIKLIEVPDFRKHTTEFNLDELGSGNYILLSKDADINEKALTNIVEFKVSNLAYSSRINPLGEYEIITINRTTGQPLSDVAITLKETQYSNNVRNDATIGTGISDDDGRFLLRSLKRNDRQTYISLSVPGDSYSDNIYMYGASASEVQEREFERTILFTDRQIYRPGQTIYFKGLQIIQSKMQSRIVVDKLIDIDLKDANQKEISSLKLKTNEFGTFSGLFIIPQSTLNGTFIIEADNGSIAVQVEEYKRPTFQISLDPVTESYQLNDSVSLSGKVIAFSGYGISGARIAYRITRTKNEYRNQWSGYSGSETEILYDTILTANDGSFHVKFKAIPEDRISQKEAVYQYLVVVDATDASAETRSSSVTVSVGEKTVLINLYLPQKVLARDDKISIKTEQDKTTNLKLPVSLTNLNNQNIAGMLKVKVYSLTSPGTIFIDRLWSLPDTPLMTEEEFLKLFPYYQYKKQVRWPRSKVVAELEQKITVGTTNFFDFSFLKKMATGSYEVEAFAVTPKGDTTSLRLYTYVIAEPSIPDNLSNWVLPIKTTINSGENAEFLVGLGQNGRILMETYDGSRLLSSKWLITGAKQELIKVPVVIHSEQFSVQFLTVFQNRKLSSYHRIVFIKEEDKLNIRFLSFRDKLQPGSKEQWKLQITSKDKQAAEMVATLYDASLDDIASSQNWLNSITRPNRYLPDYFVWNQNNFVRRVNSLPFSDQYKHFVVITRKYEELDLMGYTYYGGYNSGYHTFLQRVKERAKPINTDKELEKEYLRKAALIKNGVDVSGYVTDKQNLKIIGVSISIKGQSISTFTNSKGYFKIRVPKNAQLVFSYIGFESHLLKATKGQVVTIVLNEDHESLNEVVVLGYGTQKRTSMTGSVASLDATIVESISAAPQTVRVQGKSFIGGDMNADGIAIIEDLLKTKPKEITTRKNFNETAFFYPQLRTNASGEILIEFTIPEALTRWHFKGFAHTQNLKTGYIENELITQKSLMISVNMPRFFRHNDTIFISARIANLTDKSINGKVELQIFDGLTMQPLSLLAEASQANQAMELESSANKGVTFKLIIPNNVDAITYRLTANSDKFSDGEENTIPVLPNSMLVTESLPMMVRAGQTKTFSLPKLLKNTSTTLLNKNLTLEYTQNPVWYAVQALPYLMEYPYECSEQVFSRYFANTLASAIVTRLPKIKAVFEQWKSTNSQQLISNLEKNQELKSVLIEETPWLRNAASETEQRKRIALLFDLNKMNNERNLNLSKLAGMQRMDGGFPWFAGSNYSDRYITQYILEGIGRLNKLAYVEESNSFKEISIKALRYLDYEIIEDYKNALSYEKTYKSKSADVSSLTLHALYVRSYFGDESKSAMLKMALAYYMPKIAEDWKFKNVYEQGLTAFIMQRYNQPAKVMSIIRSLNERAQQSEELGMYWAKNQVGYYWYQSPIETQSLLIELFTEVGNQQKAVDEMKIWLLRNKQTTNWKTTKATASACYSLLLKGNKWIETDSNTELSLGGQPLSALKPELKEDAGNGYVKTSWKDEQIKPGFGSINVQNTGKVLSWGAVHWQYLEQLDKITSAETQLKLERKYFIQKQTDGGPKLIEVDNSHPPKTGDLLTVVVYLNADRDYEYIHLKDMRPSGTEPNNVISGYKYQEGFYYYQVTKDVATNFFINYLPKGKYVFEYSLRVAQPGNFSTGVTSIQCLYAPEFNAHSGGSRMKIE